MSDDQHHELMAKLNRLEAKLQALVIIIGVLTGGTLGWAEYQWADPRWGTWWAALASGATFAIVAGWAAWVFDSAR
jgi:hypothetical protein